MIRLEVNTQEAQALAARLMTAFQTGTQAGLVRAAEDGFNDSQRLVPVRTGFLKNSGGIKERLADRVTYGYDARYAGFVEFGTFRTRAQPYIMPRYNILANGLLADYISQAISAAF